MTSSRVLKGKPYSLINLYNSIFIYLLFTFTWPFSGTVGDIRHALNIVFGLYARQRRIFLRYREPKLRSEFRHILVFFKNTSLKIRTEPRRFYICVIGIDLVFVCVNSSAENIT